jgi:hypothetical protein
MLTVAGVHSVLCVRQNASPSKSLPPYCRWRVVCWFSNHAKGHTKTSPKLVTGWFANVSMLLIINHAIDHTIPTMANHRCIKICV